jgi:ElaB/YqjD/DUF883 family membrane-anchored ribosome-binding protein
MNEATHTTAPSNGRDSSSATTELLADKAHAAVDQVAKTAGKAEQTVRDRAGKAAEVARDSEQQAIETATRSARQVRAFVRRNPIAASGIAFAAGLVLSSLMRR